MKITDLIHRTTPGSIFLFSDPGEEKQEARRQLARELPPFMKTSGLCKTKTLMMDMCGSPDPNAFSDLVALINKLIISAGYRDRYDGLLLLDIADLMTTGNEVRLAALGEFLSMPEGLASCCVTVLLGPKTEAELIACAELLDFSGKLQADSLELNESGRRLEELLGATGMKCTNVRLRRELDKSIAQFRQKKNFDAEKYLRAAADGSEITQESFQRMVDNKYSYHNRLNAADRPVELQRKIGFGR